MSTIERQLQQAIQAHGQGNLIAAVELYEEVLRIEPNNATAMSNLAVIAMSKHDYVTAEQHLQRALGISKDPSTYSNLGVVLKAQGRLQEATDAYQRAIRLRPDFAEAHHNLGNALREDGRAGAAADAYRRVIELRPDSADAFNSLGNALRDQGCLHEAIQAYDQAIRLKPNNAEALNNYAAVLQDQGRLDEAVAAYQRVIRLRPNYPEAYGNLGVACRRQGRQEEAIIAYQQAIKLKPDFADVWANLGNALQDQGRLEETIAAYESAIKLRPDYVEAFSQLAHQRLHACDWGSYEPDQERLLDIVRQGKSSIAPFLLLASGATPADQLHCAQKWAEEVKRKVPEAERFRHSPSQRIGKIKVGYLSADFHEHATAYLAAELFEQHDRSRFTIVAYSYGPDDHSQMRNRLIQAFDDFVDIRNLSHAQAAARIHQDGIDILVDLKGYTVHARTEILAYRPAPIQVNYLGYPGTMGADFVDYIFADSIIALESEQRFYSEKLIQLPDCYQPNDSKRRIAERTPSRAECDLPERGFVFCCFNNSYKITPTFFDIWMRLLKSVRGSVLWLLKSNALVEENLRREAAVRGVDPQRLIFAPRIALAEHLARHRQADLFLDTLPCNAHTTASDALWAALPVLTCKGSTFAGRVAGSLLKAAGLPELVTASPEEYEALALRLAKSPRRLAWYKRQLERAKLKAPLFNSGQFTERLETAYQKMWHQWCAGNGSQINATVSQSALVPTTRPSIQNRTLTGSVAELVKEKAAKLGPTSTPDELNEVLRLLGRWRSQMLANTYIAHQGTCVLQGPFAGMQYITSATEGALMPRLLGTYESELHPYLRMFAERDLDDIIVIGCAEGYYAVGLALLVPGAKVYAYDREQAARLACKTLVAKNAVEERVFIGGEFKPERFEAFAGHRVLVLIDTEGAEDDILQPSVSPSLSGMSIIVETHDFYRPGVLSRIVERFQSTHDVKRVDQLPKNYILPAWFQSLPHLDQLLAVWEWRARPTPWLVMTPKSQKPD